MKKVVIALGGNAIGSSEESANAQIKRIEIVVKQLKPLLKKYQIVLTHGNGSQVGNLLLQQENSKEIPQMPLDTLDAMTQGQIGYWLQQSIRNILKKEAITIITQIIVDEKDPAFKNPTKPIGPFYNKDKAEELKKSSLTIKEVVGGFRRVVPSPKPIKILESTTIKYLMDEGFIVIAGGGGGIPVIERGKSIKGIQAVIDKDLASSKLASNVNADILIILTNVENVYINFKKQNEKKLGKVKLKEIQEYYEDGQFPEGSMEPKIEAAIKFLKNGGKEVIITSLENLNNSIDNCKGTHIIK